MEYEPKMRFHYFSHGIPNLGTNLVLPEAFGVSNFTVQALAYDVEGAFWRVYLEAHGVPNQCKTYDEFAEGMRLASKIGWRVSHKYSQNEKKAA